MEVFTLSKHFWIVTLEPVKSHSGCGPAWQGHDDLQNRRTAHNIHFALALTWKLEVFAFNEHLWMVSFDVMLMLSALPQTALVRPLLSFAAQLRCV